VHVDLIVVPDRHDKHHALLESVAHSLHATSASEVVVVSEHRLLVLAEFVGDRVTADTSDVGCRLLPDLAALDVQTPDLDKVAAVSVVGSDKLGHNGERLRGVDRLARAVERGVTHAEGVEVAAISVAVAGVSVAVATSASCVGGAGGVSGYTRVRGDGVRDFVGLPDVHFVTTSADLASSCVAIVGGTAPALGVGFSFDKLMSLGH